MQRCDFGLSSNNNLPAPAFVHCPQKSSGWSSIYFLQMAPLLTDIISHLSLSVLSSLFPYQLKNFLIPLTCISTSRKQLWVLIMFMSAQSDSNLILTNKMFLYSAVWLVYINQFFLLHNIWVTTQQRRKHMLMLCLLRRWQRWEVPPPPQIPLVVKRSAYLGTRLKNNGEEEDDEEENAFPFALPMREPNRCLRHALRTASGG